MFMREVSIPYGLTETGPVMTQTRYFETSIERKCTSIGQALPGIEVAIIHPETGQICAVNEPGEICCRGYNVMTGYYKEPEMTARCIDANGWAHSGDIGRMDEQGYYYFIGHMPGVQDVQVVGVPSKKYGEQPAAFVIRMPGAEITEQDVGDFCRNKIAWFKIPKFVKFVDSYPMTASQKIQKYKLREQAAQLWPDA
jgi:fatty-acyl-CoA synthase